MQFIEYWEGLPKDRKHKLAEKLGVHYNYLSMVAHGHRKAGIRVLTKISRATGGKVSMRDLRPDIYGDTNNG